MNVWDYHEKLWTVFLRPLEVPHRTRTGSICDAVLETFFHTRVSTGASVCVSCNLVYHVMINLHVSQCGRHYVHCLLCFSGQYCHCTRNMNAYVMYVYGNLIDVLQTIKYILPNDILQ